MNKKVIVVALDGYSSSTRSTSLEDLVCECVLSLKKEYDFNLSKVSFRYESARFSSSKKRRMIKYLEHYNDDEHILLLIGKSYGAKVIEKIVNSFDFKFHKTYIFTIDPCWPLFFDWSPNLNDHALLFRNYGLTECTNLYLLGDDNQQCGCPVYSLYKNVKMKEHKLSIHKHTDLKKQYYNHMNIIKHPLVSNIIRKRLRKCLSDGGLI